MLIDCGSNIKIVKLLEQKAEWFDWITLWNGNLSQIERLILLTIEGVPVEALNDDSFSKIASKWGKILGVDPAASNKICMNRGRVCILTRDYRWINEVVKVKVRSKFLEVRVVENMDFYTDFDPEANNDEQSSWVSESDACTTSSSMEDEQLEEDEESPGIFHEAIDVFNQFIDYGVETEGLRQEKLKTFNNMIMEELIQENVDPDDDLQDGLDGKFDLNKSIGPVSGPEILGDRSSKKYHPQKSNSRNHSFFSCERVGTSLRFENDIPKKHPRS